LYRCTGIFASCVRSPVSAVRRGRFTDDMEYLDFGTIFFLVVAIVIFVQLRNVLGRRTGNERPPFDPYTAARSKQEEAAGADNVVSLPGRKKPAEGENAYAAIDAFAKPDTDLNRSLRAIKDADQAFDPKTFV